MTTPIVNRLHFYHDAQGQVALVDFNGTKYSYARNLQGDIIGILGNSGNPGPDSTRILLKSIHSESNGFLCVYDGL